GGREVVRGDRRMGRRRWPGGHDQRCVRGRLWTVATGRWPTISCRAGFVAHTRGHSRGRGGGCVTAGGHASGQVGGHQGEGGGLGRGGWPSDRAADETATPWWA